MQNMYRHAIAECSHALNGPGLQARAAPPARAYDRCTSTIAPSPISRLPPRLTRTATTSARSSRRRERRGTTARRLDQSLARRRRLARAGQADAAPHPGAAAGGRRRRVGQSQGQLLTLTIKATLVRGEAAETKNVVLPISVRYKDIVDQVRNLFPDDLKEQAFALKYKDAEGDLVTVTSRTDLRGALSAAMHHAEQRAAATGVQRPRDAGLAPVEVEVVPVAKAPSETPDQIIPDHVGSRDHSPNAEDEGAEDVIEIDEWLLTFAGLFRKHLGEDGAKEGPLDLRQIGRRSAARRSRCRGHR